MHNLVRIFRWVTISVTVLLLLAAGLPGAATPPEAADWQAQWIGTAASAEQAAPNSWYCYRKIVTLPDEPSSVEARLAVDSKYWLWVNGELVVYEGQLKRGPTPEDTYYDRVDLSGHLHRGSNTIAVLVWYFGKEGFSHKSSGRPGLVFQMDAGNTTLLSDRSWKVKRDPAYENTGAPHPNYRLPESNIRYDARKSPGDWMQPGYDDSKWEQATEFGRPPAGPWHHLWERPIPLWNTSELRDYENAEELPSVSDGVTIVADLPYNAMVSPYLKIDAPAGLTIDMRTDDYYAGERASLRAEYVTKAGVQEYESYGWINGHQMYYAIPDGVKILALKYRETGYNTDFAGSFVCEDPFYNKLWTKAQRTLYITMRDTYMDCPDRERGQWWGDAVNELGESFYALDTRSHLLTQKGILELVNWQRPDSTIFSPVPAGNYDSELPLQMLNSVGKYGFWNYYVHTGDLATIQEAYPHVRKYLAVWKLKDNGLVQEREGGWQWVDWGDNKDLPVLYNAWYVLALQGAIHMAEVTGHTGDISGYRETIATIKHNFNRAFWTGSAYRSPEYEGETDDRGNALAVLAGLADSSKYPAIQEVLKKEMHASPYMEKYVLESLFVMGQARQALDRMRTRYTPMVKMGISTLPEGWTLNRTDTYNHAWTGGPLTLLSRYAAGVAPESPGYAKFHVLPQMGNLHIIRVTVPSVKGAIHVSLNRSQGALDMQVVSPEQTAAVVGVPRDALTDVQSISVNGRTVWTRGRATALPEGISFVGQDDRYVRFQVAPGTWDFHATGTK